IMIDHHAGIEHAIRIKQRLEVAHDGICLRTPFGFYEWCHVAARSVFGFEGAVIFATDDVDHSVHKMIEMCNIRIVIESLIDEEMQVAIFGMSKHRPIGISKFGEKMLQVGDCIGKLMNRKDDIFIDGNSSQLTRPTNRWNDALAR